MGVTGVRLHVPIPCVDYTTALQRFSAMAARDDARVNPLCSSRLLDQGTRTGEAVVLLHGYTNCPAQWTPIAHRFFARGANVLVPRYPHHGYADRMNRELSHLKPSELVAAAAESIDIASGLGERVTVIGFSAGGVLAAWAAANRDEVRSAMLVAPIFSPWGLPHVANHALMRLLRYWPDRYTWWDPRLRERHMPDYGYPRMSLHGLAALLELSADVVADEPSRTSDLDRLVLVLNQGDLAVNADAARRAVEEVLAPLASTFREYEFPLSERLSHDVISAEGSNHGRTERVADKLVELLYG